MKKALSVFLAVILTLSCFGILSFATEDENAVKFTVATDIHSVDKDQKIENEHPESEMYFHAQNSGNLYCEAYGILADFLQQSVEENPDFILIPGDMTNSGTQSQHEYFASFLADFEKENNIPVYIVPGNHDYFNSLPEDIKNYYYDFGFDEAIAVDEKTASYVVDLPGNYRLIAIDSNDPGNHGDALDDRLFSWIEEQSAKAKADGKTIIAMMHHPLLEPVPYAELIMGDFIVRDHEDVAERFTQWGIQYVFTGHEHGNNITSYTGENGNVVYDILTTALTSYPLEYRVINLDSDKMDIKNVAITECNFDYVVYDGYTEKQLELMATDYTTYSYEYFKYAIEKKIAKYITPEFISKKLKVTDGALYDAINAVMPLVEEALQMPLYSKDTEGTSVESLANEAGVKMPKSDYYNLYDLATSIVAEIYYGCENTPFESSPEEKVLIVGLNTMLKYILAEAGNEVTTLCLNAVVSSLGIDLLIDKVDIFRWNRSLVLGSDHSYEIAYSVLSPILDKFMLDDEISDRDCVLPGPGENQEVNKVQTFFERILNFFKYLFGIIKSVTYLNRIF